jgi:hypothetical protein
MTQVLEDMKKRGMSWQDIEKESLWEERRDWILSPSTHIT